MKKSLILLAIALTGCAAATTPPAVPAPAPTKPPIVEKPVTRAEFNQLKIEVARNKAALAALSRRSTNAPTAPPVRKSPVSPK